MQLAVGIRKGQAGRGIGHADILKICADFADRIVGDVQLAVRAATHIQLPEVSCGERQLQEAAVGRRKFEPLHVEVGLLEDEWPLDGNLRFPGGVDQIFLGEADLRDGEAVVG